MHTPTELAGRKSLVPSSPQTAILNSKSKIMNKNRVCERLLKHLLQDIRLFEEYYKENHHSKRTKHAEMKII